MHPVRKTMLLSALCAGIAIATSGAARADAFAQSILVIDNFRLVHANGTTFTASDFALLAGTNDAHAGAQLNGVFANAAQSYGILSGINPDLAHQGVGQPGAARTENNFAPMAGPPALAASFGYADQQLSGSLITSPMHAGGAMAATRADASLAANGSAGGYSDVGTSTTFSFTLGADEFMTIAFNALPFTQAYVSGGAGPTTSASARLAWSISILDISTGATVFAFAPDALNSLGNVSRSDGFDGALSYDPGSLFFSATTEMLSMNDIYQVTISQSTMAGALQAQNAPEPATLAIFGAGLLGIGWLARRRRPAKS